MSHNFDLTSRIIPKQKRKEKIDSPVLINWEIRRSQISMNDRGIEVENKPWEELSDNAQTLR